MNDLVLNLESVNKSYKEVGSILTVLSSINLKISSGELVGIVGNSGSGKSTLLHIAGLLDRPNSGSVVLCGTNASLLNIAQLTTLRSKYIGFVYQNHCLLSNFSARENVALPRLVLGQSFAKALSDADQLLIRLGLRDRLYHVPGELSGGEKQRVAIARSMINNPKLILADEPTGNLDSVTAGVVFQIFTELAKERNTAILMVTHNLEFANQMSKCYALNLGVLDVHK